ncbi:hypothetical protein B0H66DRAFT_155181 [Apodospora peruviana]|uniref:CP-type G domain-containing protein n=1 Tax=Apodospora peruviana TaxID=516989 RepID=A0AAE0MBP3_9PEZI|nr:hypothetical protein B0H66DRAFT_155181 [Apodospora peruviana]
MPQPKSKNAVGLGNTLMNDRFGKGKGADRKRGTGVTRINHATGEEYITNDKKEASWVKMRSVTEQGALDEFLATAELADTDFTAEKMNNVKIIHTTNLNPYLLSAAEERAVLGKHREHKGKLTVPRRPKWDSKTTPEELDKMERESFLNWRRGLAELQENQDLLMTPFERNLEVWRQLWRVIERSDVVVQIVDARNPLMFRSEDLESYVKDVDSKKKNLLLINKADMMTYKQRRAWADYLKGANIAYKFFSAALAKEMIEAELNEEDGAKNGLEGSSRGKQTAADSEDEEDSSDDDFEDPEGEDADTRILTVDELENIFLQFAPEGMGADRKLQVGLVGYPNVGKSSTINALVGAKKVSVSSTPGKTKHFQTIHLSDKVMLCDCPGLVFPNFASTKAELVCNGVLPIDQLREYSGPATLVARRIPQPFLEAVYSIQIRTRPIEEGGTGKPTADELLSAYARHRGFMTQGMGQPDQSRAARYVLKDYVNGKLLWVQPPPGDIEGDEFNEELYDIDHLPEKRRPAAIAAALEAIALAEGGDEDEDDISIDGEPSAGRPPQGVKSKKLDKAFFRAGSGAGGHLKMPFNHKYSEQGRLAELTSGKQLSKRKMRELIAVETGMDPKEVQMMTGKRHFKGGNKQKRKNRVDNKGNTDDLV